ncbi:hypothetical protein CTRI78_v004323 [Colletotrichum trifolii]|uniref:Uncharacterized protein n=1 Tax=Colletotrichum trifolii TaxID=5466 RepID=A0A4R8RHQ4_COLTR|nr:hypothetical protein CTRI78_v004323 [Colletotrichum trifolii]
MAFLACSPTQLYLGATFSRLASPCLASPSPSPVPRPAPNIRVGRYHHSKEENLRNGKEKREDPKKIAARSPIRNPCVTIHSTAECVTQQGSFARDPSPGMSPRRFTLGPQPEQSVIRSVSGSRASGGCGLSRRARGDKSAYSVSRRI